MKSTLKIKLLIKIKLITIYLYLKSIPKTFIFKIEECTVGIFFWYESKYPKCHTMLVWYTWHMAYTCFMRDRTCLKKNKSSQSLVTKQISRVTGDNWVM